MDLVGWSRDAYEAIVAEYRAFAVGLGFEDVAAIPLSALSGDNVVHPAVAAPWYEGPTLVRHLETVPVGERDPEASFRMPVQWVNRPSLDFRGYAGLVAGGSIAIGERVKVLPSGRESTVARIVTHDGDLPRALPGQSVTLVLADDIDVSRGDVIAAAASPPAVSQRLEARLFWAAEHPLAPGASVQVKLGAASAIALVEAVHYRIDPDAAAPEETDALLANDIGDVTLALDRPVAFDAYRGNRDTGSLILIDRETADTVGLGLVLAPTLREGGRSRSTGDRSASGRGVVARLLAKAGLSRPS
jgi:sulfate adenylyltransferase subunit 1